MKTYLRLLLIGVSLLIVAYLLFSLEVWAGDFKNLFFYLNDWRSWIAVAALIYAAQGIIKWLLMEEVKLTAPRRPRR